MAILRTKTMVQPTPTSNDSLYQLLTVASIVIGIVAVFWRWIDSYFKSKKETNETFINRVVETAMTRCLEDVNGKINTLFQYRESDRAHFDTKFDMIVKEIRK